MNSELKYHETMLNRVAVEGWCAVVLIPALKAGLVWAILLIALFLVASLNRPISATMFIVAPLVGFGFGLLGTVARIWCGRDLTVRRGWHVSITEQGRLGIHKALTSVASVEILDGPSNHVTIQIAFTEPTQLSVRFTTSCTSSQQEELIAALKSGKRNDA